MPKYIVDVESTVILHAQYDVEADNPEEARQIAATDAAGKTPGESYDRRVLGYEAGKDCDGRFLGCRVVAVRYYDKAADEYKYGIGSEEYSRKRWEAMQG